MSISITNFAAETYNTLSSEFPLQLPRQKFNHRVKISTINSRSPEVFEKIQSVSVPTVSFDTALVNQYNKKRAVQTRMNYDPFSIVFYDTFDNQVQKIITEYTRHYYNDNKGIDEFNNIADDVLSSFVDTTRHGLTALTDRYFIKEVVIEMLGANSKHRTIKAKNCIINSVQSDTLSYSDSSFVVYTLQFQPESIHVTDNQSL